MAKNARDKDRALATARANDLGIPEPEAEIDGDTNMEDAPEDAPVEAVGSKVIVIHVGSQNLRIGLASDALPKTIPMVIARKSTSSESEESDEPTPKRMKMEDGSPMEPEKMFGAEVRSFCTSTYNSSLVLTLLSTVLLAVLYDGLGSQDTHATEQTQNPSKFQRNGCELQSEDGT